MTKMNLYQKCVAKWGATKQIRQAMGECGEFIADAHNYTRNKVTLKKMMGEAVDVHIMMMQIRELDPKLFDRLKQETFERIEEKVSA